MALLSKLQYPKLIALAATFVLAYFMFEKPDAIPFHEVILSSGYIAAFFCGIFFAYGFTAAPAVAILLVLSRNLDPLFTGLIAGIGALCGDLIIFKFVRVLFKDEIERLSKTRAFQTMTRHTPKIIRKYITPALAGVVIASPLPDELGVMLFAACRNVPTWAFTILSYVLNTSGLLAILYLDAVL